MLTALKYIGQLLLENEQKEVVDILLENPDSNGTYKTVFVLEFDKDLNFKDVVVEEFKGENWKIYLYKRASGSNAPDFSPTSRITEPKKTLENKILRWFENHKNIPEINKIYKELENHKEEILTKIKQNQTKDGKIITLKIDGKYLYEIEEPNFKEILINDFMAKIKEVSKKDAVCSVCGEKKDEVFTTSLIYKFYTLDKECYITSGFSKKDAWKNFPICEECFLKIDYAKKYIEEKLKFKFYGKDYYIIPKLILDTPEALKEINEILSYEAGKITLENKKLITDDKEEIFEILKDYKDVVSFYLLFLKKDNAAERILLSIEDVLPSRIHKIFDAKEKVDKIFSQEYNFGKIVRFLDEFDKTFYEVIDKIFKEGKIDFKTLIQIFNKKIRENFLNGNNFSYTVFDALMNIKFFEEIGLLQYEGEIMENSKFEKIYQKVGKSLNTPAKRGIFLLGALTQMLLNIQAQERQSTPFVKNLKGLKMNEEDIKGLLAKVINKLMEYDKYDKGKKEIAEEISKNLLSEDKFKLNIDEINFYFVSGMALYKDVANVVYENEKESQTV
ncbi:TIGR02556 family CRISPR-associated protein [Venenivibrio stagnispumantis]|uniref:CRISPR-associated protein, Csh1 family n=1 Tax=Venenivibrio stagnispumantis TaxID=407998 RepID=A0AA45WJS3_9AQUI|nr:TIGR02556 family CRISPR-associated protein [Venenivibrio stagnispumantis]MCW4572905.1 TIGR02556 family CRISPR-associated protein [Venenivibrio stagnispumantis]SMP04214.1 CRISPR-associated protein, Csh1 family [Venenivibrio stagnispumantis]